MNLRSQKGFTLMELMASSAVAGLILPLVIAFTFQMIWGTARISQDLVIQQDLDSASMWFSRDLSQAQQIDLDDQGTAGSVRVDWVDHTGWGAESGDPAHYAVYSLVGTDLQREYDGVTSIVGRSVSSIQFSRTCTSVCDVLSVSITSTYNSATSTLAYDISSRVDDPLEYIAP